MVIINTNAVEIKTQAVSPPFNAGGGVSAAFAKVGKKANTADDTAVNPRNENFFNPIFFITML